MKILIISTIKPYNGSGSGITDYTYQLVNHIKPLLSKDDSIDNLFALKEAKKANVLGLINVNTTFKRKISAIPKSEYDIIHITDQEIGFAAKLLKKSHNTAYIITTIHDLARFENSLHKGIKQNVYNHLVIGSIVDTIKYSDLLLCNSSQTYKTIRRKFPDAIKKLKLIHHGIDDKFLGTKRKNKIIKENRFVIGYIGALTYHKNVIFILKVAKELKNDPEYIFEIYGNGPEIKRLMRFKKKYNLNNIKFKGFVNEREKMQVYGNFDVFLFPSLYEGFGLPILEAQSSGLPVIILKTSNIPKEITKHCLIISSSRKAAETIRKLRSKRMDTRQKKILIKYANNFDWKFTAESTLKVYKKAKA